MRTIVVDLEATCWEAEEHPQLAMQQRAECEIIEIGAVRGEQTFRALVRPVRHPKLSEFCKQLTSIPQSHVDIAPPFPAAFAAFLDWAGGDEGLVVACWGAFDDKQFRRDCHRHGLPQPRWTKLNIKQQFAKHARQNGAPRNGRMGLAAALDWLGFTFEGTPHRAVDDARNAARILERIS